MALKIKKEIKTTTNKNAHPLTPSEADRLFCDTPHVPIPQPDAPQTLQISDTSPSPPYVAQQRSILQISRRPTTRSTMWDTNKSQIDVTDVARLRCPGVTYEAVHGTTRNDEKTKVCCTFKLFVIIPLNLDFFCPLFHSNPIL